MSASQKRRRKWPIIVSAALVTSCVIFLFLNLQGGRNHIRYEVPHQVAVEDPAFLRYMGQLLGPSILGGNQVTDLQNGDEIFPAMLEAIRSAQKTITFETYIYWSGAIGQQFADALVERARAGVKVHVLLDWVGSNKIKQEYLDALKDAGAEVELYRPLHWYHLTRMNNRTHRKLLVIDGRIGFTGGVGIADPWLGSGETPDQWRDSHYRIEGPAVAQMQAAFVDNWIKTRAQVLIGEAYFPEIPARGESLAQVFKSSRSSGSESMRLMYLLSISSAVKSIKLQAAYFIPDDLTIRTLVDAALRGVDVEIIVPGPYTDVQLVKKASRSRWKPLLEAGVKIYTFQPAKYHCKVFIVDDVWVSVGSTNLDDRSFRLNDEANLNIYDSDFALEQARVFEQDVSRSRLVTLDELDDQPMFGKVIDWVAGLFRSQL